MKVFLDDERATPEGWVRVYWPDEAVRQLGFVPSRMQVHSANPAVRVRMSAEIAAIEVATNSEIGTPRNERLQWQSIPHISRCAGVGELCLGQLIEQE